MWDEPDAAKAQRGEEVGEEVEEEDDDNGYAE